MSTFNPQNPVYPPQCYQVETPATIAFREPNKTSPPEIDFNHCLFFARSEDEDDTYHLVTNKTIQDVIACPECRWDPRMMGMLMKVPGSRKLVPAHLPNLLDSVGRVNLVEVFDSLHHREVEYDLSKNSQVVPTFLVNDIDPTPVVRVHGPVYPLRLSSVETEMGCYTDGIQIFYFHEVISELEIVVTAGRYSVDPFIRFSEVKTTPKYVPESLDFELGSSLVIWNARGVTRPSFNSNFATIFGVHKPIIMIITEARVCLKSFEMVAKSHEYDVDWALEQGVGVTGGTLLLWRKDKVIAPQVLITVMDKIPVRVIASLKPKEEEQDKNDGSGKEEGGHEGPSEDAGHK